MPERTFQGKSVIVTGAASGMGKAVAESFADAGARVVFADVNGTGAVDAANGVRMRGSEAIGIALDVTRSEEIERCVESTLERFGSFTSCSMRQAHPITSCCLK